MFSTSERALLWAAALLAATLPSASEARPAELWLSSTFSGTGATSAYLRPGPSDPEQLLLIAPRLRLVWLGESLRARAGYAFLGTRYLGSGLTGLSHDLHGSGRWEASRGIQIDVSLAATTTAYDTTGPTSSEQSIPLVATRSRALASGVGVGWERDGLRLRGAWLLTVRRSLAVFGDDSSSAPVDEVLHQGEVQLSWEPSRLARGTVGPVLEIRRASVGHLSYRGFGLQMSTQARLWKRMIASVSVRLQNNYFEGPSERRDLFARFSASVRFRLGSRLRATLRYGYTANASILASFDADRHALTLALEGFLGPLVL